MDAVYEDATGLMSANHSVLIRWYASMVRPAFFLFRASHRDSLSLCCVVRCWNVSQRDDGELDCKFRDGLVYTICEVADVDSRELPSQIST
jgi:hypothetical protein